MSVIKGNTSTSFQSAAFAGAVNVISYSLVNKSGSPLTVTAGAILGSTLVLFCSKVLAANDSFHYLGEQIVIERNYSLFFTASGASLDYYATVE